MSGALAGQTVILIGGSAGIGFETARLARTEGAEIVLAGRNAERLERAASELGARTTAAFDATDPEELSRFFAGLEAPVNHVMVTAGRPHYGRIADMTSEQLRTGISDHIVQALEVARHAADHVVPGGSLVLMSGTGGRRAHAGSLVTAVTAAMPALTGSLALELAPVRVNLIAPGFVDTPLSADLLGDQLETRRDELRATLPIRRVVGPEDVAALAVHTMVNTALTGATYDVDGGQQLLG